MHSSTKANKAACFVQTRIFMEFLLKLLSNVIGHFECNTNLRVKGMGHTDSVYNE